MPFDTVDLIDATIAQLQELQGVLVEDFQLCRRSGLSGDAVKCGAALEAISALLPRLHSARDTQDPEVSRFAKGHCSHCD